MNDSMKQMDVQQLIELGLQLRVDPVRIAANAGISAEHIVETVLKLLPVKAGSSS